MKKFQINKNILLILTLVILAVAGYFFFFRGEEVPLVSTESNIPVVGGELFNELNRLNALRTINGDLFKNPAFRSLNDITQPVTPQPLGRVNPFLPIGSN